MIYNSMVFYLFQKKSLIHINCKNNWPGIFKYGLLHINGKHCMNFNTNFILINVGIKGININVKKFNSILLQI